MEYGREAILTSQGDPILSIGITVIAGPAVWCCLLALLLRFAIHGEDDPE